MPTTKKKTTAKKAATRSTAKKTAKKAAPKKAVKKVAKKTTKKKAAPKKAAKKSSAKKDLVYAPDHASFWVTDGQVLNSLLALRDALDEMEKEVFSYHVSKEHNDFANWVDSVLYDAECAAALHKARTPKTARTVVVRHLKLYSV